MKFNSANLFTSIKKIIKGEDADIENNLAAVLSIGSKNRLFNQLVDLFQEDVQEEDDYSQSYPHSYCSIGVTYRPKQSEFLQDPDDEMEAMNEG